MLGSLILADNTRYRTEGSLTAGTPLSAASKETFGSSGISAVLKKVQVPLVDHRVCQTHLQNQKLGSRCGSWSCHTMSCHVIMSCHVTLCDDMSCDQVPAA